MWYGEHRHIPLPAGITCSSPILDMTHSAPTFDTDDPFDTLPNILEMNSNAPPCNIWPSSPPRRSTYADDHLLTHPLVSPALTKSWQGIPPIFLFVGWEKLAYENKFLAKKLAATNGVKVVFQEYEALPHSFSLLIPHPNTRRSFDEWGAFINSAVKNPRDIVSSASRIKAKTGDKKQLCFEELSRETDEGIVEAIKGHAKASLR
jgi:acetyl esterase/lipase